MSKDNPYIFILILNWNNKDDTIKCVESVQKINYAPFKIILIDNSSEDDSVQTFKNRFPNLTLLENKKNLGYGGGNNVGIRYALEHKADCVFILNNDAIVEKDILNRFVDAMQKRPDGGIFGAKVMHFQKKDQLEHFGGNWNKNICEFVSLTNADDIQLVDYVCGCSFFIKKEVIERIGYFEPKFFLLWEESDYCFCAKRSGFLTYAVDHAIIWHKVSASFKDGKPQMHYFWWRNRLLWVQRNCSKKEKRSIYQKVLLPEIIKIYKLRMLKSIQIAFLFLFVPKEKLQKRINKLNRYKAGCRGIRDYFLKRFGNTYKKV